MVNKESEDYLSFINEIFDKVKKKHGFTDVQLSEWLNDNKSNLSNYRRGKRVLSDWKLIKAANEVGVPVGKVFNVIIRHKPLSAEMKEAFEIIKDAFKS